MGEGGRIAVIVTSIALVLFVFAVMLGNYLGGLATNVPDSTTTESGTEAPSVSLPTPPSAIKALGVVFGAPLDDVTNSTTVTDGATDTDGESESTEGFDAVSVRFRSYSDKDGVCSLSYKSEICTRYSIDTNGEVTLSDGIGTIRSAYGENIYISGVFEVRFPAEDEMHRGVMREYELALLGELLRSGIDEIILVGFSDFTDCGLEFISELKSECGDGTLIGLSLDFKHFDVGSDPESIRELSLSSGLLALDLSDVDVPELMSIRSVLADRISRAKETLNAYSVRVLLGGMESEELYTIATDGGVFNFCLIK
jgi:hypothetical protein